MPFKELPDFIGGQLAKDESPARLALLFTILTAARSGEVRKSTWAEINLDDALWNWPAEHMKSGRAHTVTLSHAALNVLERAKAFYGEQDLIFPNSRDKPLSDAALGKMMRDSGREETVHGFRSTFRDWAAEKMPTIPFTVAELALAHAVGNATERAYLRSDLRDMRCSLMNAWGAFAAPSLSRQGGNVVAIHG